jgi:hypothetical protein
MILYSANLSFKISGGIKVFHDRQKLKQYMINKPPLQKILKEILHTEDENKHNYERMRNITTHRTDKYQRVALNQLHTLKYLTNKNN